MGQGEAAGCSRAWRKEEKADKQLEHSLEEGAEVVNPLSADSSSHGLEEEVEAEAIWTGKRKVRALQSCSSIVAWVEAVGMKKDLEERPLRNHLLLTSVSSLVGALHLH